MTSRNNFSKINKFSAPPGKYNLTLKVTSQLGCVGVKSISILIHPAINLMVWPTDTIIDYGSSFRPQTEADALFWNWFPPDFVDDPSISMPLLTPKEDMDFLVLASNEYGCIDSARIRVRLNYTTDLFLPSAFSPNGDGLNDIFKFENIQFEELQVLKIYNRFGQMVFQTRNIDTGWDGTFRGKPVEGGVYFYFGSAILPNGRIVNFKGDVTLLR